MGTNIWPNRNFFKNNQVEWGGLNFLVGAFYLYVMVNNKSVSE